MSSAASGASGALSGAGTGFMAGGPVGAAIGGIIGGISSIFGAKAAKQKAPKLAARVNLESEARKAIPFNSSILNEAVGLSSDVNDAVFQEGERLMQLQVPGLNRLREYYRKQLEDDMNSKGLPKDVEQYIQQQAAERGIQRGTSGQFNDFNLLRDFGFSAIDHERAKRLRTLQTFQTLTNLYPRVNPMSPTAYFLSPASFVNDANREQERMQSYYNTVARVRNHNAAMMGNAIAGIGGNFAGIIAANAGTVNTNTAGNAGTVNTNTAGNAGATIPNYYNQFSPVEF